MGKQRELFPFKQPESSTGSPVVIAIETKIAPFGNRTDLIVVEGRTVRGASLLECNNPDAEYFNSQSDIGGLP